MRFPYRVGLTLMNGAILIAGCGRDQVSTEQEGRALFGAQPAGQISMGAPQVSRLPGVSPRGPSPYVLAAAGQSPAPSLPPPPSPKGPEVLVLEWTLVPGPMDQLIGETLIYQDPESGEVVRGAFEANGLLVTAQLDERDGFIELPPYAHFLIPEHVSSYPMSFYAPDRGAVIEVMDCDVEIDEGRFHCWAHAETEAAIYEMRVVRALSELPDLLWCVQGCPGPDAGAEDPFLSVLNSRQGVAEQAIAYEVDAKDGVLLHDGQPLLPEPGAPMVSGALFKPADELIDALACDLDDDGEATDTCVWQPLPRFYTYSVNADHILPFRGPALVHD